MKATTTTTRTTTPFLISSIIRCVCCWMGLFLLRPANVKVAAAAFITRPSIAGCGRGRSLSTSLAATTSTTVSSPTTRQQQLAPVTISSSPPTIQVNGSGNNNNTATTTATTARPITTSSTTMATPSATEYPLQKMTEDERYLFDLNGYLVIRGVFSAEEVAAANAVIDKYAPTQAIERDESTPALRNAKKGTAMYGTGVGRQDLGQILEWGDDSALFKSVLAHPRLVPLFHGILGKGYRMDHLPFCILQNHGAEGFQLHGGTVDCTSGEYNHHLAYTCHNGQIRSALLACSVVLTDHDAGDGGFCIVPGSHKSNFKMPDGMVDGMQHAEYIRQPVTKAGDVVLFTEGTVHGALPWTPTDKQRRVCLYRFAPATNVYGRSYFGHGDDSDNARGGDGGGGSNSMGWPRAIYEKGTLTDAQRAVLEPPYANRLDRPNIREEDGSVEITTRSAVKRRHDEQLFGTKYF